LVWFCTTNKKLDPVESSAYILGDQNSTVVSTINYAATLRCAAGGFPKPFVTWWKGDQMIALKTENVEITRDYSIQISRVTISDLGPYVCQAYNSVGRPVSVQVTLKAYGPLHATNDEERRYLQYEEHGAPVIPQTTYRPPTRPRPTIGIRYPQPPIYPPQQPQQPNYDDPYRGKCSFCFRESF
jgi:papilin